MKPTAVSLINTIILNGLRDSHIMVQPKEKYGHYWRGRLICGLFGWRTVLGAFGRDVLPIVGLPFISLDIYSLGCS
jgi:hypothetical protein